jgi:hypothetical protein
MTVLSRLTKLGGAKESTPYSYLGRPQKDAAE